MKETWWKWLLVSIMAKNKPHAHHKTPWRTMKVYNTRPVSLTIEVLLIWRLFFFSTTDVITCFKVIKTFKRQNSWTDPFWKISTSFAPFLDCKTVAFFLKISKEIGKAWRKSFTRAKRASLTASEKKPTVRFPYNEFVPTRGFKKVVELSKICSQLRPLCEFDTLGDWFRGALHL